MTIFADELGCLENAINHGVPLEKAVHCDPDVNQLCDDCPFTPIAKICPGVFKFKGETK